MNSKYFGSNFRQVNFAGAPDSTRIAINTLIETQTRDKIKNLLPPGSVNPLTRLVLTNAIYFKDSWATRFDPEKTKDRDFFVSPNKPVKAKFMALQHVTFNFFENELVPGSQCLSCCRRAMPPHLKSLSAERLTSHGILRHVHSGTFSYPGLRSITRYSLSAYFAIWV
jgi:hypothetical protein